MRPFRLLAFMLAALFIATVAQSFAIAQDASGPSAAAGGGGSAESGVYGFSGARQGDGVPKGVVGECVWIYDSGNKTQVGKGDCDEGKFRVPLKPGRYVVRGPGGNQPVEVKDGHWVEVRSVVQLPMVP